MSTKALTGSAAFKTFTDWANATRQTGQVPTEAEVKQVARQFKVPVAEVQAVRAELLQKQTSQLDDAGARTKSMRQESQQGLPQGLPKGKGIGAAAALVKNAPVVDKALTKLPAHLDVATAQLVNAVPLKSDDPAISHYELLQLADGKNHRIDLTVAVPKDGTETPKLSVQLYSAAGGLGKKGELSDALARSLLPLLDAATARRQAGEGPKMSAGREVLHEVLSWVEQRVAKLGQDDRRAQHDGIQAAAERFDKGDHAAAEKLLAQLANSSPFGEVRARAHYVLGDMVARFGRIDEAINHIIQAFPRLGPIGAVHAQEQLASLINSQRDFPRGQRFAEGAIREGLALRARGEKIDLGSAYFTLGFAQKNQGNMTDAVASMRAALAERPGSTATQLALAGYLAIAGKKTDAEAMFASIPVPPRTELAFLDYHVNAAWFAGVSRNKEGVLKSVETALTEGQLRHYAGHLDYFRREPDLDWLRGDKDFEALLARFQS